MSYTKNTWQSGDVVTSAKLNNMENGIEAAQFPDVTSADAGKVLAVTTEYSKGAVIVPEQSVTVVEDVSCQNANTSLFTVGTEVILTIDGNNYVSTVYEDDGWYIAQFNNYTYGFQFDSGDDENPLIFWSDDGTYTISLNVANASYEWEKKDSAVFMTTLNSDSVLSNTYAEIKAVMEQKRLCYIYDVLAKETYPIVSCRYDDARYIVGAYKAGYYIAGLCNSEDDYPDFN